MSKKLLWVASAAALALAFSAACKSETDTGKGGEGGEAGAGVGAAGGTGGGTGGTAGGGGAPACADCNDTFAGTKPADQDVCTGAEEDDFLALLDCLCGTADAAGVFNGPCQAECKCAKPIADGPDKGKAQEFTSSAGCATCANKGPAPNGCSAESNKCSM